MYEDYSFLCRWIPSHLYDDFVFICMKILFLLYDVTMSAIEGDASQWLVAVVWTGMSAIFKFYVDEGRKW